MKIVIEIIIALSIIQMGNYFYEFNDYIKQGKLDEAKAVLTKWEKVEHKESDPQYYICWFNYYLNKSMMRGYAIQKNPPTDERKIIMMLKDPKTGETAGYMVAKIVYDESIANQGIDWITKGIQKFPDHYEMRFGYMYVLKELGRYDEYINALQESAEYLKTKNLDKIYWNENKVINSPKNFFIETLQENFYELVYSDLGEGAHEFLLKISDIMVKYFPESKYGYTNKGILLFNDGDCSESIKYFKMGLEKDSNDSLILTNIGIAYKLIGDKKTAITYFEKVIQLNNNDHFVKKATEELKNLNNE